VEKIKADENTENSEAKDGDGKQLKAENKILKQSLVEKEIEMSKLKENNEEIGETARKLQTENSQLKEHTSNTRSEGDNDEVKKYKEFMTRVQGEYNALEKEVKRIKEKHQVEIDALSLKRMETEEKYGQVLKEKELFKEKERVFLATCDALTT
jgi:hypothetical protein